MMKRVMSKWILFATICLMLCLSATALAYEVYSGFGDDVVELRPFDGYHVYEIEGNAQSRYFGVIPYTRSGERLSSLVNTTDVYHGIVYEDTLSAAVLEVKATGSWKITVRSIYTVEGVQKGDTITGNGDCVFVFYEDKGTSTVANIKGNKNSRYFGVIPYDGYGNRLSSLVNTTDVYSGNVMLKNNPRIFEVLAEGEWSITFK